MKKNDFVKVVTSKVKEDGQFAVTLKETDAYLKAIKEAIIEVVQAGDEIAIPGLMKFSVADQKARTGRNPMTGEALEIPARKKVKAKILGELKSSVQ